jgi:hypothetical protein
MKNIFSKCLLYIKLFHQIHGVGGGRKICLFSSYSSVHLGVGGGGGVGWDGMKNIAII